MRVLLADGDGASVAPLDDVFSDAGVDVVRCHEPGARPIPCKGLASPSGCPLDHQSIDAVVVVSSDDDTDEVASASGAVCALRQFVPLVLVGQPVRSALGPFASSVAIEPSKVVDAVDAAVAAPLPQHEQAARTMFREVLDRHGLFDVQGPARVSRSGEGSLRVSLQPSELLPQALAAMASVRVAGAVRAFDSSTRCLSVGVEMAPQPA